MSEEYPSLPKQCTYVWPIIPCTEEKHREMVASGLLYCDHCAWNPDGMTRCATDIFRHWEWSVTQDKQTPWHLLPQELWCEIFKWVVYPHQIARPYAQRNRLTPISRFWFRLRRVNRTFRSIVESDMFFAPVHNLLYTDAHPVSRLDEHVTLFPSQCNAHNCTNPTHFLRTRPTRYRRVRRRFCRDALKHRLLCKRNQYKREIKAADALPLAWVVRAQREIQTHLLAHYFSAATKKRLERLAKKRKIIVLD